MCGPHALSHEDWSLGYFVDGLEYEHGSLCYSADYVSGRMMKTEVVFDKDGEVTLTTRNRGKSADKWLTLLKGKKHLQIIDTVRGLTPS